MAGIAQIAMCTTDLPRTIRTYAEVLGFENGGGRPRWGQHAARVQGLPTGDDTYCMMWWLVGRQGFVQIELFHHTSPHQRPRPTDWSPADLGWTRLGVTVPDLDLTLRRLRRAGLPTLTDPVVVNGLRRVCFREPGADVVVELMEEAPSPDVDPVRAPRPAVAYVTVSVTDLQAARTYLTDAFGWRETAPIHLPEHEALWGLAGARRTSAVLQAGDVLLEVVQYETPVPRPAPAGSLLSDQGIMNVALGYRDRGALLRDLATARSWGATATTDPPDVAGGLYLRIVDQLSLELLLVPSALDGAYGFEPQELVPGSAYAVVRTSEYDDVPDGGRAR